MSKRPKSREETPKEGSDSAKRYRTATICDRAAQSARAFETFPERKFATLADMQHLRFGLNRSDISDICASFEGRKEPEGALNSPISQLCDAFQQRKIKAWRQRRFGYAKCKTARSDRDALRAGLS